MSKIKTIIALALVGGAGYGVHAWHEMDKDRAGQRVVDRVWIDHLPKGETDPINVFVVLSEDVAGRPIGIFEKTSVWQGAFEAFTYVNQKGALVATFPQTKETQTITPKASRCEEAGMDFCLEIDGASRGVKKYYSRKGWEIEGAHNSADIENRIQQVETAVSKQ